MMLSILRSSAASRSCSRRLLSTVVPSDSPVVLSYNGLSFSYRWLRDSCLCPGCVHPSTRQKLHRTSDIPLNVRPTPGGVQVSADGVRIYWETGHRSEYSKDFLELYGSAQRLRTFHSDPDLVPWNVNRLQSSGDLYLTYSQLQTPSGLLEAIQQLTRYGLLFVMGVPNEKTSSEECELRKLAQRFGDIRVTFYGETWDVKNVKNSRNIAYTNIDLGLHMDLLYFQHPPRFQILHCLRNRVAGGASYFVDALHAASRLRESDPEAFNILTETPVEFHYINDGHHLHHAHPTIELAPRSTSTSLSASDAHAIAHINYSPPFQAPLPISTPPAFYPALERFVALLEDPAGRFEYLLREGDAVLFDNRRVLHARTAFSDKTDEEGIEAVSGETMNRWLKGCYLEADAVLDRGRILMQQALQQ